MKAKWKKSTRCDSNLCVEVATAGGGVAVRDSERSKYRQLSFSKDDWTEFVRSLK